MIRNKALLIAISVLLLILTVLPVSAITVPKPTDDFYIYDSANVISDQTESEILAKNAILKKACGSQVVIVTLDSLAGESIEDFSRQLFEEWKIGDKKKNNGMLLVLSISDEDYWLTQGNGLDEDITSSSLRTMLDDYLEPDFANKNYDAGVLKFFSSVYLKLKNAYNIDESKITQSESGSQGSVSEEIVQTGLDYVGKFLKVLLTIIVVLFLLILAIVLILAYVRRKRYQAARINAQRRSAQRPQQPQARPAQTQQRPVQTQRPSQSRNNQNRYR